jgi:hypothetical protein
MSKDKEPLTAKERMNRNILIGCLLLGGVLGVAMALISPNSGSDPLAAFNNDRIPPAAAIIFAVIWGILLPILAYFWHKRAIDEQEAAAYRDGGYYAAYAFIVAAPVWWLLARSGIAPDVNGVAVFVIFNLIWVAVWFYKKYF